jgi:tetratricopeptide (TPR) repeat protein
VSYHEIEEKACHSSLGNSSGSLVIILNLFPQIEHNSLIVAVIILAAAIEVYGFIKDRTSNESSSGPGTINQNDSTIQGQVTNVTGKVQGSVATGGDVVDMQEATVAIYKPSGPVDQHIGDRITQIIQPSEKLPVPRIQIPPQDFTGREEELGKLLSNFNNGASITGLRGMGGVGKTALALVLADRLKSRFGDGQIFLKMDGTGLNPLKPTDAMAQVIRAFRGSAERLPEGQDELQNLYNSVLDGKKVLLLLDNAADSKQVEPLLPPKGCAVIVTSRKKFTLPGMPEPFLLDTMKPSDARDLLLRIYPRIGGHADELAKLCGYLPLALRASASLLAVKSDLNPGSYLEELRSERTRLKKIGKEGVDLDVEASFNLSYSRLPAEMASVFCKLSIFPSDFDAAAEEAICQDQGHTQLSDLVTWCLVEFEEEMNRYSLHDLTGIFAASLLDAVFQFCMKRRHAEYYKNVLSKIDELYVKGGTNCLVGRDLFDREWTNINTGQKWAEDTITCCSQETKSTSPNSDLGSALRLSNEYPALGAYVIQLRLNPTERIRWLETAVAAARLLKDIKNEGLHLGNLGIAYIQKGEVPRAIELKQRLSISQKIGDIFGESNAIGNLGIAYAEIGETSLAIKSFKRHIYHGSQKW